MCTQKAISPSKVLRHPAWLLALIHPMNMNEELLHHCQSKCFDNSSPPRVHFIQESNFGYVLESFTNIALHVLRVDETNPL